MSSSRARNTAYPSNTDRFYQKSLAIAEEAGVPFLVGGAFALCRYTGIERDTKDLDLFVRRTDCDRLLEAFAQRGHRTEVTFPHWLGKVYCGDYFVDVIFSSGNGIAEVDDYWIKHAVPEKLWGLDVLLIPAEEMIWSKSFVMERERYDGADIAHVLYSRADHLDWRRLLWRFGENWRVLMSHLVLFGYIYPHASHRVPRWVIDTMTEWLRDEAAHPAAHEPLCRGTILSRQQYLIDIQEYGLKDARLAPRGAMTSSEIASWTAAIEQPQ